MTSKTNPSAENISNEFAQETTHSECKFTSADSALCPIETSQAAISGNFQSTPVYATAFSTAFYSGDHYVIEESIGYLIRRNHVALQQDIDALMQPLDLTAMQWGPLLFILHGKGDTAADIARCGGSDTGAVTRMLDRLETKGLVARKRSSEDRRVVHLELTDAGKQIAEKIPYALAACMNQRLQGFTQQEVDTFKSLLRRILNNTQSLNTTESLSNTAANNDEARTS